MPRGSSPSAREQLLRSPRVKRADVPAGDSLCDHCTGKCCRYFSLPIKTPATWDDYDEVRWFLAHGQTLVYIEKDVWYLLVMTKCQYLQPDNRCGIYLTRPEICRAYTTDDCEFDSDWGFDRIFEAPEQISEFAEAVLPPRRRPRPGPVATPRGLVVLF
jgi:Fe-S-cluster containining protein